MNYTLFFIPLITILYMAGGQIKTQIRRFGVPSLAVLSGFLREAKNRKKALIYFLLIPILCMGYGVKSFYAKVFKIEWLIRLMYALTLFIPFVYMGKWWAFLPLVIAYQIRAGGLKVGRYDFLWEDLCRGLALGIAVCL